MVGGAYGTFMPILRTPLAGYSILLWLNDAVIDSQRARIPQSVKRPGYGPDGAGFESP